MILPLKTNHANARKFLKVYRETASVPRAAKAAKIHRAAHYRWLKDSKNYAEAFEACREEAAQVLEEEALRRAVDGIFEAFTFQGAPVYPPSAYKKDETGKPILKKGAKPYGAIKRSDALLMFLLKGAKPDKYRERGLFEGAGGKMEPIQIEIVERLQSARKRIAPAVESGE